MTDQEPIQPSDPAAETRPIAAPVGLEVPVGPVLTRSRRRRPLRWLVALVVVALVVTSGLGAALLLTGSATGVSTVAGYAPADTVVYAEARLDLPGSQRAEVAKTLAAFPGFADQAALDTKLAEVYDRIVRAASNGGHDYQTEIGPWFGGQLAVASGPASATAADAVGRLPACSGGAVPTAAPSDSASPGLRGLPTRVLLLADVTDTARAGAWVTGILAAQGASTSDVTCDAVTVHLVAPDAASGMPLAVGWAVLGGKVLVAGDLDSIRLAIATKGTAGLASTEAYQKAVGALAGDHVGILYEAVRSLYDAEAARLAALDSSAPVAALTGVLRDLVPEWIAGGVRAADGNLVVDTVHPAGPVEPTANRASDLAALAPAGTIALVDAHDVGKILAAIRSKAAADVSLQPYVKQVDTAVGLLGGFDSVVGWIGDAGLAVTRSGSSVSGGILIRPDDAGAAKHFFTQLRSLAALAGMASGTTVADEDYRGVTITTLDLGALAPAIASELGGRDAAAIPGNLKLVYALTDKAVVLTADVAFAKAVIDASQGGASLAGDPRFSALLGKSGDKVTALSWVDVTALRDLVEAMLRPEERTAYEADIRPYLLPFDALIGSSTFDSGLVRGTAILSIKH